MAAPPPSRRETPRRRGRGRLSSIDLLPEEAEPDVAWAVAALRARKKHAAAIFEAFNSRLADRGIGPVSKSAWSRYSVRKAISFRKLDEVRRISNELVESLGMAGADDVTVATVEMIKLAAFQMLESSEKLTPKDIMELSRALASAVNARKGSAEDKKKRMDEVRAEFNKALDKAEGNLEAADQGGAAVLKRIREEVYGIFDAD